MDSEEKFVERDGSVRNRQRETVGIGSLVPLGVYLSFALNFRLVESRFRYSCYDVRQNFYRNIPKVRLSEGSIITGPAIGKNGENHRWSSVGEIQRFGLAQIRVDFSVSAVQVVPFSQFRFSSYSVAIRGNYDKLAKLPAQPAGRPAVFHGKRTSYQRATITD